MSVTKTADNWEGASTAILQLQATTNY